MTTTLKQAKHGAAGATPGARACAALPAAHLTALIATMPSTDT